jgi:transposase
MEYINPGKSGLKVSLDKAGWHQTGGKLKVPKNISLLHLPPYSPELDPVENIWLFLRQNHLSNRIYESYDDILDVCCAAWNALTTEPKRIASIATCDWASVIT